MSLHRHRIGVSTQRIYETRESFNCYIKKIKSSVIRQKSESQTGRFKKCSFFGKFGVLYFLETPVLRFALLLYYCRHILLILYLEEILLIARSQRELITARVKFIFLLQNLSLLINFEKSVLQICQRIGF